MFSVIPLMVVPFIAYNVFLLSGSSAQIWTGPVFSLTMISGGQWVMSLGDTLLVAGLFCLFVEILKSTRTSNTSVLDHLFSAIVFIIFLVEFLVVPGAATSVFFLLMIMSLIDLMAGFSVSIRSAGRDISYT